MGGTAGAGALRTRRDVARSRAASALALSLALALALAACQNDDATTTYFNGGDSDGGKPGDGDTTDGKPDDGKDRRQRPALPR